MQVSEFQFNPKLKKDTIFESFCYEPENEQEKKLGNLYIVAEIQNNAINNSQFLNNLATLLKQEYYSYSLGSPEEEFKKALKKANQFLIQKAEQEEALDWLKNLNLAIFSLSSQSENENKWQIHFSKKGSIKIIISREKEIQEINQKPSKTIENITSGELLENDKIMVFTEQVFDFLENNNLIEKISSFSRKKEINKILKEYKKDLSKMSGIFLLIILKPDLKKKSKFLSRLTNLAPARKVKFNLKNIAVASNVKLRRFLERRPSAKFGESPFSPNLLNSFLILLKRIQALPQKILEGLNKLKLKTRAVVFSKKLILIFLLILILVVGYSIFENERKKEIQSANQSLEEIREKIEQAESFLIIKDEAKANLLFQDAWKDSLPLTEKTFILKDQAQELKESIEEQLYLLNKIEEIKEPILSNDFDENDFGPKEIIYNSKVYSLNSAAGEIIKEGKIWEKSEKLIDAKAIAVDGSIWVLTKDNKIDRYYAGKYQETLPLNIFPETEKLEKIYTSPALSYIYLLEPSKNRVIIIDKAGIIIKQFISEKFDNLIWLLNSSEVYKIEF